MPNATWKSHPPFNNYNNGVDWSTGIVPGIVDTATFGTSSVHKLILTVPTTSVGSWTFTKQASNYSFAVADQGLELAFYGNGIVVKGGSVRISNANHLFFENSSSAGSATIVNVPDGIISFESGSNAGHATISNFSTVTFSLFTSAASAKITNNLELNFSSHSTAGNAVITTANGGITGFGSTSDGGHARFITLAGGKVDFSFTTGPAGDHFINAGSIEGAGSYFLGGNDLTVGSNNRSTTVRGLIADGGAFGGSGATLEKVGFGTLKLSHANNTFSGGMILIAGTLDIAAIGAAGASNIVFASGSEAHRGTLKVENSALSNHQFTTEIQLFFTDDKLLLPGLKFKPHAKATYDSDNGVLTVKSGHVIDTFTQFFNAAEGHYRAVSDGHGGTKVVVVAPHAKSIADQGDTFQFNLGVARGNQHRSVADLSVSVAHHAGAGTQDGYDGSLDVVLHPHMAGSDLWHHGDFVR